MSTYRLTGTTVFVLLIALLFHSLTYAQAPPDSSAGAAGAAMPLRVNLALDSRQNISIAPGTYSLELLNTIPGTTYSVTVGPVQVFEQTRLPAPDFPLPAAAALAPNDAHCRDALRAIDSLRRTSDERQVPARLQQTRDAIANCDNTQVRQAFAALTEQLTTTVAGLRVTVPADSRTSLFIARNSRQWEALLSSLPRGRWQLTLGVTFVPNGDDEYFSQADGSGGFVVAQQRPHDTGSLVSLPSALWTWLPADQAFRDVQHGPTAGIGVSPQNGLRYTALLLGYTVRYNQNVGMVVGGVLHPQRRLDGRYSPKDVLIDNVEVDALHDNEIRLNWFFGMTFRLGG